MSIDSYQPHLLVIPEDQANRQVANGFQVELAPKRRCFQILPPSGGWHKVRESVVEEQLSGLLRYPQRRLLLLIDFDGDDGERRREFVFRDIPEPVRGRVYLLGAAQEPEDFRNSTGKSYESIGMELARACFNDEPGLWGHTHLQHNQAELGRLIVEVKPFLFT